MIDWDTLVLAPLMAVFGENPEQRPTYGAPGGGVPFEFDGIFDDAYKALVIDADGEPEISTIEPVIGVRLAQFPVAPVKGGRVTLPRLAKAFLVVDVQPDGHGAAKLMLNLTA